MLVTGVAEAGCSNDAASGDKTSLSGVAAPELGAAGDDAITVDCEGIGVGRATGATGTDATGAGALEVEFEICGTDAVIGAEGGVSSGFVTVDGVAATGSARGD